MEEQFVPLKFTLVEYVKGDSDRTSKLKLGDKLGKILALVTLAPYFIFSSLVTLFVVRRDLFTV